MIGTVTYILPQTGAVYSGTLRDPRVVQYRVEPKKLPNTDMTDEGRIWLIGFDRHWHEVEAVRMKLDQAATEENVRQLMNAAEAMERKPAPGTDYNPD